MRCCLNDCRNIADLKMSGSNAESAECIHQNHEYIDCKKGNTVKNGKPLVDLNRSSCIIAKLIMKLSITLDTKNSKEVNPKLQQTAYHKIFCA